MLTDESVVEWASGWLRDNTPEDPTFRQRFLDGLAEELKGRRESMDAAKSDAYGEGATAVWSMLGCGADSSFPNEAIAIPNATYPNAQYSIVPKASPMSGQSPK